MRHFRALERMYVTAPINQYFKPSIHIKEGTAEVRMAVRTDMHHAARAAHGAVYFKMLDDAAFFAVQSLLQETFVLTVSFNLHLLAPVASGEMVATGTVVHQSKRLFVADAALSVDDAVVARGSGTFMRSSVRLDHSIGYIADS